MFDNGRVDDVFSDQYYGRFAVSLHQILEPWRPPVHPLGMFLTNCDLIWLKYWWLDWKGFGLTSIQ